jgi:Cytochrome c554 and c-prime
VNEWKASSSRALSLRQRQPLSVAVIVLLGTAIAAATGNAQQRRLAQACARCHPAQAASEPLTPMGRALELPGENATLALHQNLTTSRGTYAYAVKTRGKESTYSVTDGTHSIRIPIIWSFGEGAQTWVLEWNGALYESMVSYYPSVNRLDVTTGDEALRPETLEDAIGRKLSGNEVKACFGCHATNAVVGNELTLGNLEPGVGCEHCHRGAESHLISETMSGGDMESAPPSLGRMSSEEISNFCGQCHRTWELVARTGWRGPANVRFQPYRLANSKCFDGTDHRISCLACHDPHKTVVHDDASYDPKCLACHTSSAAAVGMPPPRDAKVCPVGTSKCVSCHMPRVHLPNGLMTFYDHEIRIVKPGAPYPN